MIASINNVITPTLHDKGTSERDSNMDPKTTASVATPQAKLTRDDLVRRRARYFEIVEMVSRADGNDALLRACEILTRTLGFDRYLFAGYFPGPDELVVSTSYPDHWRARYLEQGYVRIDPIVRHCWTEASPVRWSEIEFVSGKRGRNERLVMEEADRYGLRFGVSVPVHGPGAEGGLLSLTSGTVRAETAHESCGLQMVAQAIHRSAKTILVGRQEVGRHEERSLSRREAECLNWIAKGKTSKEAATILQVSENTVVFHLKNSIRKLEATNRAEAVAKAVSQSKITPF